MLNSGAKFCRACGSPQAAGVAPPAPPPPMSVVGQAGAQTITLAGLLAILGGAAISLLTLFATIYQPLHYDYPVNYDDSLQGGDVIAFALGVTAVVLGVMLLSRPRNPAGLGTGLLMAGAPVFVLGVVWAFADFFDVISEPFYFGFVYFADFGRLEVDEHVVQVPLLIAGAMIVGAGLLALLAGRRPHPPR